jgi:hypothetical protein
MKEIADPESESAESAEDAIAGAVSLTGKERAL